MAGSVHIGTSGWSYQHWRNGVFYPRRLPSRLWLPHFATQFSTVEINSSFYRLPSSSSLQTWKNSTPDSFLFAVKMWRAVTHYHRLRDSEDILDRFFTLVDELKPKLGPVLVQLPPGLAPDLPLLQDFLQRLGNWPDHRLAVEFRNKQWLTSETKKILQEYGAALVVHDMVGSENEDPGAADFVYVRRHGPGNWGKYTPRDIENQAAEIDRYAADGKDVYVYFNNDAQGYAIEDASLLNQMVLRRAA